MLTASPSNGDPLRISFPRYTTSIVTPIPQINPLNPSSKVFPALSTETLKDTFLHLVGYISDFTDLKKYTVVVNIVWRWGQLIMEEGAIIFAEV